VPPGIVGALNNHLADNPQDLIKTYAICPPSAIGGYQGKRLGKVDVGITAPLGRARLAASTRSEDIITARVDKAHKVAYINLKRMQLGSYANTGNEGGDRIYFETDYANPGGWVPIYWLPWNTVGAAIRLTIPAYSAANPGPSLFFTAAINGCSVFFQGTAQSPTIYHCGGDAGQGVNALHGAQFWQEVVAEFMAFDAGRGKNKGALDPNDVNKTHYIKTPGVGDGPLKPGEGTSTLQAQQYKAFLENANRKSLRIESVNPWGCVMGVRDAVTHDWKFYLQENATVIYHQLYKSGLLSKQKSTETRYVARPMTVKEAFPNGPALYTAFAQIPKIL
jgi:hypothetical protein